MTDGIIFFSYIFVIAVIYTLKYGWRELLYNLGFGERDGFNR